MVATLTKIFGIEHLSLAEDVVQEALVRALQTWPFYGVPQNPSAWIMRASRNLALDVVRRQKVFQTKQEEIIRLMDRETGGADEAIFSEEEIRDDRLRLMFVCCHQQDDERGGTVLLDPTSRSRKPRTPGAQRPSRCSGRRRPTAGIAPGGRSKAITSTTHPTTAIPIALLESDCAAHDAWALSSGPTPVDLNRPALSGVDTSGEGCARELHADTQHERHQRCHEACGEEPPHGLP